MADLRELDGMSVRLYSMMLTARHTPLRRIDATIRRFAT